jgi:hypothetical protein
MIIRITILRNKEPLIIFPPEILADSPITRLGFAHAKTGNNLILTLAVEYNVEDVLEGKIYEVAKYETSYTIETDGKISAEEIYPVCKQAVHELQVFFDLHSRLQKIPQKNIPIPPLSHLRKDLQIEVDWFHAH